MNHGERLRSAGEHAARVAHELHAPVTLISGSLENLDKHYDALLRYIRATVAELPRAGDLARLYEELDIEYALDNTDILLAICGEGARRLNYIVDQLKRYTGAGASANGKGPIELRDLLRQAVTLASSGRSAGPPPIDWVLRPLPEVFAAEQALIQGTANVLSNAFDAVSGVAAPRVWVRTAVANAALDGAETNVRITPSSDQDRSPSRWVEVRIRDNGPGIPSQHRSRVFDPFFSTKTNGGRSGLGLGLAIAKDAIESQGGTLLLDDTDVPGCEFVIRLPAHERSEEVMPCEIGFDEV